MYPADCFILNKSLVNIREDLLSVIRNPLNQLFLEE